MKRIGLKWTSDRIEPNYNGHGAWSRVIENAPRLFDVSDRMDVP